MVNMEQFPFSGTGQVLLTVVQPVLALFGCLQYSSG